MDPSAMTNGGAFQTSRYNFAEIWSFPISVSDPEGGLDLRRLQFGHSMGQFAENASVNRDVSRNDRTVPDKGKSQSAIPKKRRGLAPEDDPAKAVSSNNDMDDCDGKRIKMGGSTDENLDSKAINSSNAAEQDTKPPGPPKQDYIHVRARRGQATDSHSLAERARREKISERMKILQDLVPGCSKVIGKALVLDEIINYIQSLQRQVEFLSMKLEAINSRVDPPPQRFPTKDFGQQTFGSQATREYERSSSPEWLHMQIGGSFERTT